MFGTNAGSARANTPLPLNGVATSYRILALGARAMDDPKVIDLQPQEWRSERDKPHEPLFGPGAPAAIAWLIGFGIVVTVTYYFR